MSTWKEWEKRLTALLQNAAVQRTGPLILVEIVGWTEEDQIANRDGSDDARGAFIEKYVGPLPPHFDPLAIRCILVVKPTEVPDANDEPRHIDS